MFFQLVQILYWLALSTWFGGVLFVAIAAPVIFRTVRESNPVLPNVLSVNLEGQHGTLLAGSIVGSILARVSLWGLGCAVVLLFTLIVQIFMIDLAGDNFRAAILRMVLFAGAAGIVLFDWWIVWPRIQRFRAEYIEHADEPEIANPAKEQFDREHRRSVALMQGLLFLLLGMILFSGNISPRETGATVHVEPIPSNTGGGAH